MFFSFVYACVHFWSFRTSVEYDESSKITDNNETDEKWYELVGLYGSTLGNKHLPQDVII